MTSVDPVVFKGKQKAVQIYGKKSYTLNLNLLLPYPKCFLFLHLLLISM